MLHNRHGPPLNIFVLMGNVPDQLQQGNGVLILIDPFKPLGCVNFLLHVQMTVSKDELVQPRFCILPCLLVLPEVIIVGFSLLELDWRSICCWVLGFMKARYL